MRGSGTEPVFRVMADVAGANVGFERELLEWQRDMVTEADGTVQQWRGTAPNNN
jgi:phosphoglucomutase